MVGIFTSVLTCCAEPERVACVVEVSTGPETCTLYGEARSKELVRSATTCHSGKRAPKCPDGAKKICLDKGLDRKTFYYAAYESKNRPGPPFPNCEERGEVTVTE